MTISLMVVDDHPLWREGVAKELAEQGLEVVATAGTVGEAVRRAEATRPAVVLMDMQLPDGTGVEGTAGVLRVSPESMVLVLSASGERDDVLQAVKAGAVGYLVKSASLPELVAAIRDTAAGVPVFSPGLAGLVLGEFRRMSVHSGPDTDPAAVLTGRETDVLRMVAKGLTSKQIGNRLVLSPRTVDNHIQSALRKLQLGNRVELARYALENGIAD